VNAGITGEISHIDCGQTWFVIRRRSPIVRYAKSSPREVRKQGPDSAARFPDGGNLLRRRCPGRGSMVPLRQVSTLTCVSPRTAGDGHPDSTLRCSPALSEALGDSSGRCSGPPLVVP
jgi:hypothetical protein